MYLIGIFLAIISLSGFGNINGIESAKESPIIELQQGQLKGIEEVSTDGKPFYSFYGIPFAKPPIGSLRFEAPLKHEKWEGVLEATKSPNVCLQVDFIIAAIGGTNITGTEDCLYLNVYTPKPINQISTLPVMVFIHGGAFMSGATILYPPYVLLNEDIVLVVIQYRVAVFGFLSTEDSTLPGNMGLKDQTLALQWVRDNIQNFGGNPEKVTIFGESAGGGSVHLHMLSPGSKGLFSGAIAQSGSALCPWEAESQHRNWATEIGKEVDCILGDDSDSFKKCLQNLDGKVLLATSLAHYKFDTTIRSVPRVDGDFLPDNPITLIKAGKYHPVNLINGVTRDEGGLFTAFLYVNPLLKKSLLEDLMTSSENIAAKLSKLIFEFYLQGKTLENNPINEITEVLGDRYINICSDLSSFLHAQDKRIKLYLYQLDHRGQRSVLDFFPGLPFPKYVAHGDDLLYLFSGGPYFGPLPFENEEDIELRRNVTKMWTNFAKYGNPTPPGSFDFVWNPATITSFEHLSITPNPKMMGYPRTNKMIFWISLTTPQIHLLLNSSIKNTVE